MADDMIHYSGPIISRRDAAEVGQTRYFTGAPCKYGHISQRMTANTCCSTCLLGRTKKFWNEYRAKSLARGKRWRDKNIEHVREMGVKNSRIFRTRYPDDGKQRQRIKTLIKLSDRERVAGRKRPSACEVCGGNDLKVVFDHCHKHGHFRGWICGHCNMALGLVKDNSSLLRKLAKYLDRSNGKVEQQRAEIAPIFGLWASGSEEISGTG